MAKAKSSAENRGSVLVVDDDTDMLKLLARWLGDAGFEALTADSGPEALRELGRLEEAVSAMTEAHAILEASLGPEHPNVTKVVGNVAAIYERMGRDDDAAAWRARAATDPAD